MTTLTTINSTDDLETTSRLALNANFSALNIGKIDADGSVALTADWDAGSFKITAETFASDVATGTSPFTIASTTVVANLNVDSVDGYDFDQALLQASSPTFAGLALGAGSITMSGSIGVTGTRVTKGWFTDLEVTNAIAGSITGNASTVTTNANLTGVITSVGNATSIASQTGTGTTFVVANTPTLVTPEIGVATGTSLDLGGTTLLASRQITVDTGGGLDINMGTASGDDFSIDTSAFVVEGDTGNVGIGTTSPGNLLDVAGSASAPSLSAENGVAMFETTGSNASIEFGISNVSPYPTWIQSKKKSNDTAFPLAINPLGGNVGIGTTEPDLAFSVAKTGLTGAQNVAIFGQDQSSGSSIVYVGSEAASDKTGAIAYDHDNNLMKFYIGGDATVNPLVVANGGNVGIGTTGPDRLLHAEVSDAVTAAVTYGARISHITSGTANTGFGTGLEFELEGADTTNLVAGAIEVVWTDASTGAEDADIILKRSVGGAVASEGLRLVSDGTLKVNGAYSLPAADGNENEVLQTNGSGVVSWAATGGGDFANGGEAGGADRTLGNTDNYDLGFLVNNSNVLHLQNDGKIGVNTTSPLCYFHVAIDAGTPPALESGTAILLNNNSVAGDNIRMAMVSGSAGVCVFDFGDTDDVNAGGFLYDNSSNTYYVRVNAANRFYIESDGGIFMPNLLAAAASTDVNINGSNELHSVTSSERFKYNIEDIKLDTSLIDQLQPRSFVWGKDKKGKIDFNEDDIGKEDIGLIAEEVEKIYPELVNITGSGIKTVKYNMLSIVLLNEVKQLRQKIYG